MLIATPKGRVVGNDVAESPLTGFAERLLER